VQQIPEDKFEEILLNNGEIPKTAQVVQRLKTTNFFQALISINRRT